MNDRERMRLLEEQAAEAWRTAGRWVDRHATLRRRYRRQRAEWALWSRWWRFVAALGWLLFLAHLVWPWRP